MTNDLKLKLTLSVDKKEGETNLQAFNRAFDSAMTDIGKSADDIDAFKQLSQDLIDGKEKVEDLDEEAQQLFDTFKQGAQQAADQDILDINYLEEAQQEIDDTIAAYKALETAADRWNDTLKDASDIDALERLNQELDEGKVKLGQLNDKSLKLLSTYRKQAQLVSDRDLLGIRQHSDIQKEIDETRAAYKRLKNSGELTQKELAQAAIKTEDRIRSLKAQTNGWVESLEQAKGSLAALAGSAAGLAVVSSKAIQFEAALADVRKVVDGTDADFERLTGRIKSMTEELPLTATGLAQIAAAGGQLGVPIDELDQFIELAARMSVAFDLSVDQAGEAVAKLSNIFNIPIENVEALGDAINTLGNTTAAKEAEILNVLTRIGGTASQFKLTAEQSAALAATMIEMGASSEVAGTGINALLTKLQTANVQGPKFQDALDGMGISANQLAENIRTNPQQALTEFLRTLSQLDDEARAETLTQLFGQEYQDDIARLLNGLDKYDASLKRVTDTGTTAGAMQREFNARMETTEAQIQLMQNGLNAVAINLGSIFLPAIREGAVLLGDASAALAKFVEANPAIATIVTSLGTAAVSAGALRLAFLSMRYVGVKAFGDIGKEAALARGSLVDMRESVGKLGTAYRVLGGIASAAFIGWDIGTYLHDEFEVARLAGVRLAQSFTWLIETADALWQVLQNPLDAEQIWDNYKAKLDQVNQTYQQMYDEVDAGEDILRRNATAATETGNALEDAGNKGADAAIKIREEFARFDLSTAQGITALTKEIDKATEKSDGLSSALKKWINEANASDLSKFSNSVRSAFEQQKISAEQLAEYNNEILKKSFDDLGLSAEAALQKISPEANNAIIQLDNIAVTLTKLEATATQKMAALEAAVRGAIGKADTQAAINEIAERIQQMGDAGEISAEQVKRLNDELEHQVNSINQLIPGIQSAEDAMKRLGVTSQAELKKAAASSKEAYEYLVKSKAPIEDQRRAFVAYAKSAIEANDGVVSSELEVQAAVLGVSDEFEKLGNKSEAALGGAEQSANNLAGAVDRVGDSARDAAGAVDGVSGSMERVSTSSAELADGMSKFYNGLRNQLKELAGDQALAEFDQMISRNSGELSGMSGELDELAIAADNARREMSNLYLNLARPDFTGFSQSMTEAKISYNSLIIAADEARRANDEMSDSLDRAGERASSTGVKMWDFNNRANLSGVKGQVDDVAESFKSMEQEADRALDSVTDRLNQALGNQRELERAKYLRERTELEQKLAQARAQGDGVAEQDLANAIAVLDLYKQYQDEQYQLEKTRQEYLDRAADAREKNLTNLNDGSSIADALERRAAELEETIARLGENYTNKLGALQSRFDVRRADAAETRQPASSESKSPDNNNQPVEFVQISVGGRSARVLKEDKQDMIDMLTDIAERS